MARPRNQGKTITAKGWLGVTNSGVPVTSVQAAIISIANIEGQVRETILRSRGEVLLQATPDAATDSDVYGFGLIVVHSNAVTIGTTALPGPIADIGADWLWHRFVPMDAVTLTAADPNARAVVSRFELDSKAMRKIAPDHTLVLMAESGGVFASAAVSVGLRVLLGH